MTISEQAVREEVRAVVAEKAPVPATDVTSETVMSVDLGYDSLLLVELVAALEDRFGLEADEDDDAADVETVRDVEDRVVELLRQQQGETVGP